MGGGEDGIEGVDLVLALDVEFAGEFGDPVGGLGECGEAVDVFGMDVGDLRESGAHLPGAEGVLFRCHGPTVSGYRLRVQKNLLSVADCR